MLERKLQEILINKKIFFNYDVIESFNSGIILKGYEVKSIKNKDVDISNSYIYLQKDIPYLINCYIKQYNFSKNILFYDPSRKRKLLLKKNEILKIKKIINNFKNTTIVPYKIYINNNLIKFQISIVKGKKKYDKREKIKEKIFKKNL